VPNGVECQIIDCQNTSCIKVAYSTDERVPGTALVLRSKLLLARILHLASISILDNGVGCKMINDKVPNDRVPNGVRVPSYRLPNGVEC
jgi:hypothetical protein